MSAALRNLPQNARFHAICGEAARQATFAGRTLSAKQWKILFVSAHEIVMGEDPDIVKGIEGEIVSLRERTASMSTSRMASLIEYATAWCIQNGVHLAK